MKSSLICITIYRGLPKSKNCWLVTELRLARVKFKPRWSRRSILRCQTRCSFPLIIHFVFSQETTTFLALPTSSYLITTQKRISFARGPLRSHRWPWPELFCLFSYTRSRLKTQVWLETFTEAWNPVALGVCLLVTDDERLQLSDTERFTLYPDLRQWLLGALLQRSLPF